MRSVGVLGRMVFALSGCENAIIYSTRAAWRSKWPLRSAALLPERMKLLPKHAPLPPDSSKCLLGPALVLPGRSKWLLGHCLVIHKLEDCSRSCIQNCCPKNICSEPRNSAPLNYVAHCSHMDIHGLTLMYIYIN